MANTISHRQVREFYEAHMLRDPERIAQFLHDDVEWSVAGPIDLIPFCGQRRGKEAAIDTMVRIAPALLTVTKLEFDELLVDGERAAGFNHLTAIQNSTGRTISYQRAEFFQSATVRSYPTVPFWTASTSPNRCSDIRSICRRPRSNQTTPAI